jgi:hypothetical protein
MRGDNDTFICRLYAPRPAEFYLRRLEWLRANGMTTAYNRLVEFLKTRGMDAFSDAP